MERKRREDGNGVCGPWKNPWHGLPARVLADPVRALADPARVLAGPDRVLGDNAPVWHRPRWILQRAVDQRVMRRGTGSPFTALLSVCIVGWCAAGAAGGETYFNDEGVAFHAFESPARHRMPLWRLLDAKKVHAFTSSLALKRQLMDESGAVLESSGIYLSDVKLEGMVPLYEFKRSNDSRTILIVGEDGRRDLKSRGDEFVEIPQKAFVYPPEFPEFRDRGCAPVHVLRNPFTDVRLYSTSQAEIRKLLAVRDARLRRLRAMAGKLRVDGSVLRVAPVGEVAKIGALIWRFERSDAIGSEVARDDGPAFKARGEFVAFDVWVENTGSAAVALRTLDLLVGPSSRVPPLLEVGAAHAPPQMRFAAGQKLLPGERDRLQFVYDLPKRAKDVVIEVYGHDASAKNVMVLDTGR